MTEPLDLNILDTVRVFYNEGNVNNKLLHIRGIVDGQYIVRWWSRRRQRWMYKVEHPIYFEVGFKSGSMTKGKKDA